MQQMQSNNSGGAIPSNPKSTILSANSGNGNVPATISNLTSFQQSHSERTSMTDDANAGALTSMQWQQVRDGQPPHAQCSTERYTNDQRVRFLQQLHSNEVLGTSQNSGGYPVSNATVLTKKHGKDKLFFVTDHKLYEEQSVALMSGVTASDHGSVGNTHNSSLQKIAVQHPQMMYDIDMENVQVKSVAQAAAKHSIYPVSKLAKKGTNQPQVMIEDSGIEAE